VTNYGVLAIIALVPSRKITTMSELQLLIALETVTPDDMGFRHIGMKLLAAKAGLPYGTARHSARRLIAAGLIFCVPGSGKGHVTRWRILFSLARSKVSAGGHLPATQRCPQAPLKVSTGPAKGVHVNSLTRADANTGLNQSGLNQSGLPAHASADAEDDAEEERLIKIIIEEIKNATGKTVEAGWAVKIRSTLLDGRQVADPIRYLRKAIRGEPDPRERFLPITRPGY
jgi:hypothetical protein